MNATPIPEAFQEELRSAREAVLFLDYDGTLAPFHRDRMKAVPYPGVGPLLDRILSGLRTRVVLVTGRLLAELDPLLPQSRQLEVWGSHGWEHRTPGTPTRVVPPSPKASRILGKARNSVERLGLGHFCEVKPGCLAFHVRTIPAQAAEAVDQVGKAWEPLADPETVEIHPFDGGIELRARGRDKGVVVGEVLETAAPGTPVAYLGDDLTDEDAFRTLRGRALCCLVRHEPRPTAANHWLKPPEGVIGFLEFWLHAVNEREVRHVRN